ncbi:D-alanyl-D-alanine carboxypeptidase [Flavobacteriaceae bacterium]|nr:D-alanyl-D-alanine carboxypeptidase [Flavobacteriaceae bacterium]
MKKALILFLLCSNLYSQISSKKIDRWILKNENLKSSVVSIAIKQLNKDKKISGVGFNTSMTPASNIKILTVLGSLTSGDTIPSIKYKISNDTLRISSTGYPFIAHPKYDDEDLETFIKSFNHIVYHKPNIDLTKYGPAWAWDDFKYYFQAERSEMPIYGNVIQIVKELNDSIKVTPDIFQVENNVKQKEKVYRDYQENNFSINPSLIKAGDTIYYPFVTSRKITMNLLESFFQTSISYKKDELKNYKIWNSMVKDDIYSAILKDSDNLISESLAANISLRSNDTISVDKGLKIILNSLEDNKIQLYDGSGLSRYNLIKPSSLVLALEKIYQYLGPDRIKKVFSNNYIITGTENFVWGKTGTLKNNHNYSGYIVTDKGRQYVFSIMINHFTDDLDKIKEAISDFLKYIKSNA